MCTGTTITSWKVTGQPHKPDENILSKLGVHQNHFHSKHENQVSITICFTTNTYKETKELPKEFTMIKVHGQVRAYGSPNQYPATPMKL